MPIDVTVTDKAWDILGDPEQICDAAFAAAQDVLPHEADGHVSVLFGSDDEIADLNRRLRGRDGPTNVLSFPAHASAAGWAGDIALACGVVSREAATGGLALGDHVRHLLIHGFLHLHGYDHQDDDEAEAMEAIERRALNALGVADPYVDRGRSA